MSATKWAGAFGVLCGALFLIAGVLLPLGDLPATNAPAAETAAFLSDHRNNALKALIMLSFASGLMAMLMAGLREHLDDAWSRFGLAVGIATIAIFTTGFAGLAAAAYRIDTFSPETVQALSDFAWATFAVSSALTVITLLLFGVSILATGKLPAWLGWATVAVGVVHVTAALAFACTSGAFSLEGFFAKYVPAAVYLLIAVQGACLYRASE